MMALILALLFWIAAWGCNIWLANSRWRGTRAVRIIVPMLFGVTLLVLWEGIVRGLGVSQVILPAPSLVAQTFATSLDILWTDFVQTVVKGAFRGFAIGAVAAFLCAIAIDRSAFLTRGLLPIGNFLAALPIVGVAPIMVNWFGFDWQSKAAVVVVMVFFPILVNTVQGLKASDTRIAAPTCNAHLPARQAISTVPLLQAAPACGHAVHLQRIGKIATILGVVLAL